MTVHGRLAWAHYTGLHRRPRCKCRLHLFCGHHKTTCMCHAQDPARVWATEQTSSQTQCIAREPVSYQKRKWGRSNSQDDNRLNFELKHAKWLLYAA